MERVGDTRVIFSKTFIVLAGQDVELVLEEFGITLRFMYGTNDSGLAQTSYQAIERTMIITFYNVSSPLGHASPQDIELGTLDGRAFTGRFVNHNIGGTIVLHVQMGVRGG